MIDNRLLIRSEVITSVPTGECEASYYYTGGYDIISPSNGVWLFCDKFPEATFKNVTDLILRKGFTDTDLKAPLSSFSEEAIKAKQFSGHFYHGIDSVALYLNFLDGRWLLRVIHRTPKDP